MDDDLRCWVGRSDVRRPVQADTLRGNVRLESLTYLKVSLVVGWSRYYNL